MPCAALALEAGAPVASKTTDQFVWQDASCETRTAAMIKDQGGWARQFSYMVDGEQRVCTGTGANGWEGFGYAVTHFGDSGATSNNAAATSSPTFVGRHHAIYRYEFSMGISGQQVPVTVEWFFATGRNNPIYAITYDASATAPGSLVADTRSPYGDIFWEGALDWNSGVATVAGVGWGDHYKFLTTKEPLTLNSSWDYTEANTVPYAMEWSTTPDAEMGIVQTQTYMQHDGGGYWFYANWGKTSANQTKTENQIGVMPEPWNWTYQLNQYELCFENTSCVDATTSSHRLAWGANYGAVGGATPGSPNYPAYGDGRQVRGHPYQSYSVFVVLGKHSDAAVANQVRAIEAIQQTRVTPSVGAVATEGPGGVGRTDVIPLDPPGYDHRYGVWTLTAAGNVLEFQAQVASGTLPAPIVVVSGYSKSEPPAVIVDGCPGTPDIDYFMSLDTETQQVWITFRNGWTGAQRIEVR